MRAFCLGLILFSLAGHAQPKRVINILFVGKTQTGKSSLINIFYNHIVGKKYEDARAIVIPLRDGADDLLVNVDPYQQYGVGLRELGQSQTTQVLRYTATNDRYIVHLWDAPGFNDTNQEIADEEIAKRIAVAIGETSFNLVAIVLRPNEPATFDMKANIDRVRTMLPKTAAKNLVGIFTRTTNASKGTRKAGAEAFANLTNLPQGASEHQVYFIDGTSFFDDGAFDGPQRWLKDGTTVEQLLGHAASLNPFNAREVSRIQNIVETMRAKAQERNTALTGVNVACAGIERIQSERASAQANAKANQGYEKKRRVRFEAIVAVHCRALGFLWSYNCGTQKRYLYRTEWTIDDDQKARFFKANAKIKELISQEATLTQQKEVLTETEKHLLRELRGLRNAWRSQVMSSDTQSFIDYLALQIDSAKRQSSCHKTSCDARIALLESQKKFYEFVRDL